MLPCTENRLQHDLGTISLELNFALNIKFKLNILTDISEISMQREFLKHKNEKIGQIYTQLKSIWSEDNKYPF